jgi:hypothetical protein
VNYSPSNHNLFICGVGRMFVLISAKESKGRKNDLPINRKDPMKLEGGGTGPSSCSGLRPCKPLLPPLHNMWLRVEKRIDLLAKASLPITVQKTLFFVLMTQEKRCSGDIVTRYYLLTKISVVMTRCTLTRVWRQSADGLDPTACLLITSSEVAFVTGHRKPRTVGFSDFRSSQTGHVQHQTT